MQSLDADVGRKRWTNRFGTEVGRRRRGWMHRLDEKVGCRVWTQMLDEEFGLRGWT